MKDKVITDKVAISIRGLWHIESMEEKKAIIRFYDNLHRIFFIMDTNPKRLTADEFIKFKKKRESLNDAEKDLLSEIFVALHLGLIIEPPEYTIEEVKNLYDQGLYFTKEELKEMIEWQFHSENHNPELVVLLGDYLEKHLYFDTIEDAEKHLFFDDLSSAK